MNVPEPIAIVGISFRFPGGATTSEEFWQILSEKINTATEYPKDRFNIDAFWHPDSKRQNTITSREGHFIKSNIKNFDAGFFSMAPHEAGAMDPQHRSMLETTYHAFESAGMSLQDVAGTKTSVHVGCFTSDFAAMQNRDVEDVPKYNALGTAGSMLANRISWFYDLHGESMFVDTACSSSLVALALGCRGLASGESDIAVVGGSNLILIPDFSISLSNMSFLSPGGKCRSFDEMGDGYGRGEGFAVLVLKPLSKAIADGNPIRALIRSVGLNQDGHTSSGITQPNKDMQVELIHDTYRKAGLDPSQTRYFEAHGTGTPVGDPIEARAIGQAFYHYRSKDDPLYVGSVKSNLGHLEGASGLAGIVKTVLALERGIIPPNANFKKANPNIDGDFFNLRFPTECLPWPKGDQIRRASVNSFGFGGTNAHVVLEAIDSYLSGMGCKIPRFLSISTLPKRALIQDIPSISEEAQPANGRHAIITTNGHDLNGDNGVNGGVHHEQAVNGGVSSGTENESNGLEEKCNGSVNGTNGLVQVESTRHRLIVLTASDEDGIARQAQSLAQSLSALSSTASDTQTLLDDIVFTLNSRRTMLEWKSHHILESLDNISSLGESMPSAVRKVGTSNPNIGFIFTGQGAQWARMGYELLEWPIFAASIARSNKYLKQMGCTWSILDELATPAENSQINSPEYSQAITTAIQIALVDLIEHFELQPTTVVGHSSGEIAAAYSAGFLSHESAMKVSYFRGVTATELAQQSVAAKWGMASVGISAEGLQAELDELRDQNEPQDPNPFNPSDITISCINSPANITISAPEAALDLFVSHLSFKGLFARKLKVDVGYHSPQMNLVSSKYSDLMGSLRPRGTKIGSIKMVSSVLPGVASLEDICCKDYWVRNMLSPVQFTAALAVCCTHTNAADAPLMLDRSHENNIFIDAWLEVGPHAALRGPLREIFGFHKRQDLYYTSLLMRGKSATSTTLDAIGSLFCRNFELNLSKTATLYDTQPRETCTVVDLPQYSFNHSVIHWDESARSKAFRARDQKYQPLLGAPTIDWNPLDAKWRLKITKDRMPWVTDHKVQGSIWYPAAGMIAMAVEAIKQLLPDEDFDFELQNVSFTAPIVVKETNEGTETQISMTPTVRARGNPETDYKFKIFVKRPDDTWDEVCDGTITPQRTIVPALDVNDQDEEEAKRQRSQNDYNHAVLTCQQFVTASELYQKADENCGLQYGPSFQGLGDIHYDEKGHAHAELKKLEASVSSISKPFTIHPATLDSIFQLSIPAIGNGVSSLNQTLVPSRLTRLWISRHGAGTTAAVASAPAATETDQETGDSTREVVYTEASFTSKRSTTASSVVFSQVDMQVKVKLEGFESTQVSSSEERETAELRAKSLCHELVWKVDPTLLEPAQMSDYCAEHRDNGPEPDQWFNDMRRVLLGLTNEALLEMQALGQTPIPSMEKYTAWLRARLDEFQSPPRKMPNLIAKRTNQSLPSGAELKSLAKHIESTGYRGSVNTLVARQLREILTGTVDPLQMLFADPEALTGFYEEVNTNGKAFPMLAAYLDAWVHKEPGLKFLEVGAGTGATTNLILDMIANAQHGPRYSGYTFTDVSSFFFTRAKERFSEQDRIQYQTLDIEANPEAQGFQAGTYDVVVAANVLHTCKSLAGALENVRRLLKPGGKLILLEATTPNNIETGFSWGTLPGWWQGYEDGRQLSAVVSEDRWDHLLKAANFSGTEQIFYDWDSKVCHDWSIMVSSAVEEASESYTNRNENGHHIVNGNGHSHLNGNILHDSSTDSGYDSDLGLVPENQITIIVDSSDGGIQTRVSKIVQDALSQSFAAGSTQVQHISFENLLSGKADIPVEPTNCILLADVGKTRLHEAQPGVFQLYQKVLTKFKYTLWVQSYEEGPDCPPYHALAEGLARVCRSENPFAKVVTLSLESKGVSKPESIASQICKIWEATRPNSTLQIKQVTDAEEQEFKEVSGYLCVNRLRQAKYLDEHVFTRTTNPTQTRSFGSVPPAALSIKVPGLLDTIEWVEDTVVYSDLTPDDVEIEVKAIGVNFKECLTLLGRVNSDDIGSECAGYVTRVGSNVTRIQTGDRVVINYLNPYRTLMRAHQRYVVKLPDSMSFEEAAGVPTPFCTAYYSLYSVAKLQKGESILIHAAAGGTGQAAVQMAQHIGAEVFATVGSASKRDFLVKQFGIPTDHIFYSRNASFADGVRRMTNGRGVDVVLNSLSGKLLVASWELLADFGRFVEIGRKDIDTRGYLPMFPFIKNTSFSGVDLLVIMSELGKDKLHILQDVFDMMGAGILRPAFPVQPYPIDQAEHAFRFLVSGKSTGKIVLTPKSDAPIRFKEGIDSNYRFSKDATYVVSGGMGGIGRQIVRWMARRGAAHILLLVRSSPEGNPEKLKMIEETIAQGVNLQYRVCDITDLASMETAVQDATREMPPIRGCFQAAMVIQDRPFEKMNEQEWREALQPKVQGSWNLHKALPSGMDFFIMLSSAVSIFGNIGQANYAAGNTFQDAVARYRVSQGEKAVAIDLGMVLDQGWVAERENIMQRVMQFDNMLPLSQPDLFAILDYYCDPSRDISTPEASQIITGIELPALILRAGRQMPDSMSRPLFRAMHQIMPGDDGDTLAKTAKAQDFAAKFEAAETAAVASEEVAEALKLKLCKILGLDASNKTINDRMDSFGVDSLIALEIRNWLAKEIRADLAIYEILGDAKLIDTGAAAVRKSEFRPSHWDRNGA